MKNETNKVKSLQVLKDKQIRKKHTEELGMSLPSDYFQNSKNRILNNVKKDAPVSNIPIKRNKYTWISVAATIAILFSVAIFNKTIFNTNNTNIVSDTLENIKNAEFNQENLVLLNTDDITITSLFVEDSELDDFIDSHVLEELIEDNLKLN